MEEDDKIEDQYNGSNHKDRGFEEETVSDSNEESDHNLQQGV